jgi:hypothetical protein
MKLSKQKKKHKMLFGMVKIEGKQQGHLQSCIFWISFFFNIRECGTHSDVNRVAKQDEEEYWVALLQLSHVFCFLFFCNSWSAIRKQRKGKKRQAIFCQAVAIYTDRNVDAMATTTAVKSACATPPKEWVWEEVVYIGAMKSIASGPGKQLTHSRER